MVVFSVWCNITPSVPTVVQKKRDRLQNSIFQCFGVFVARVSLHIFLTGYGLFMHNWQLVSNRVF